jgi:hypothetical protein
MGEGGRRPDEGLKKTLSFLLYNRLPILTFSILRKIFMASIKKINRGTYSVFEALSSFSPIAWIHKKLYPNAHPRWRAHDFNGAPPHIGHIFFGALQPFVDMAKDAADSVDKYKSKSHVAWDALQLLRGIGNILKGLATIVAIPFMIIILPIIFAMYNKYLEKQGKASEKISKMRMFKNTFASLFIWAIAGASSVVRGLSQIIFTPLSWVKMLVRGIRTGAEGYQKLQDDRGIRNLVEDAEKIPEPDETVHLGEDLETKERSLQQQEQIAVRLRSINSELKRKAKKAVRQGRGIPSNLDLTIELPPEITPKVSNDEHSSFSEPEFEAATPATATTETPVAPEKSFAETYYYIAFFRGAASQDETNPLLTQSLPTPPPQVR